MDLQNVLRNKHVLSFYLNNHNKYKKKYNDNFLVLMEVGSFFEVYSVINDKVIDGPDVYRYANILDIQCTSKNKKIKEISYDNWLLIGVPSIAIQKYIKKLLNNDITIILIEQVTPPPRPERKVTKIISPGTYIDDYNQNDNNYCMSIYLESYNNNNKIIGLSVIDISTGENYIHKIIGNHENNWIDDISRYMNIYNPIEIIFHSNDNNINKKYIHNTWDLSHDSIHINIYNNINDFKNKNYQNNILSKVFKNTGLLSGVEYIDLEFEEESLLSYIYLLEFINEHQINILENINKPIIKEDNKYLILSNNSARQLNIINNYNYIKDRNDSLLSVTNHCNTTIGKRLWKERILYPILDIDILNFRYNMIDYLLKDDLYIIIREYLSKITNDNDKILRKMSLNLLLPYNLYSSYLSYNYISKIIEELNNHNYIKENYQINNYNNNLKKYISYNDKLFNFDNFLNEPFSKMTKSIFQKGIYQDLDQLDKEVDDSFEEVNIILSDLSYYIDNKKKI